VLRLIVGQGMLLATGSVIIGSAELVSS